MWIYLTNTDGYGCITVGFYDPNGDFQGDSDHTSVESAAERVHYLNGGVSKDLHAQLRMIDEEIKQLKKDAR